jgi:hypothetical protein
MGSGGGYRNVNDNDYWRERLQDGFAAAYPGKAHRLRLPSGVTFTGRGDAVRIGLSRAAVEDTNMQQDAAAFEAWALALHGYAGAKAVLLDWEEKSASVMRHAWRFRFRAAHFARIFGSWFTLARKVIPAFEDGQKYLLNVENEPRRGPVKPFSRTLRERELEDVIVRDPLVKERFRKKFDHLDVVGQQLPVGVFKGKVSKSTANVVSPRGSAAIDIWGRKGETLHLFELKKFASSTSRSQPLGILSEALYYALLMREVQKKNLTFESGRDGEFRKIPETKRVHAWLLAPAFHPLIEYGDAPIIDVVNAGMRAAGEPVTFGRARIDGEAEFDKA